MSLDEFRVTACSILLGAAACLAIAGLLLVAAGYFSQPLIKWIQGMNDPTIVVQIGNTDNKLTQKEWSEFCNRVSVTVNKLATHVHFEGGAPFDAPWQNACWVCVIPSRKLDGFKDQIGAVRKTFRQDSAALTIGSTALV